MVAAATQTAMDVENALRGLESSSARERRESSAFLRQCARTTGMLCLVSSGGFYNTVAGVISAQSLPEAKVGKMPSAQVTVNQRIAKVDSMFLEVAGRSR